MLCSSLCSGSVTLELSIDPAQGLAGASLKRLSEPPGGRNIYNVTTIKANFLKLNFYSN